VQALLNLSEAFLSCLQDDHGAVFALSHAQVRDVSWNQHMSRTSFCCCDLLDFQALFDQYLLGSILLLKERLLER
jgi:hypothetical protein